MSSPESAINNIAAHKRCQFVAYVANTLAFHHPLLFKFDIYPFSYGVAIDETARLASVQTPVKQNAASSYRLALNAQMYNAILHRRPVGALLRLILTVSHTLNRSDSVVYVSGPLTLCRDQNVFTLPDTTPADLSIGARADPFQVTLIQDDVSMALQFAYDPLAHGNLNSLMDEGAQHLLIGPAIRVIDSIVGDDDK